MVKIEIAMDRAPSGREEIRFSYESSPVFGIGRYPERKPLGPNCAYTRWKVRPETSQVFYIEKLAAFYGSVRHMPSQLNRERTGIEALMTGSNRPAKAPLPDRPEDVASVISAPQFQGFRRLTLRTPQGDFGFEKDECTISASPTWTPQNGVMTATSHLDISEQLAALIADTSRIENLPVEDMRWLLKKVYTS